ncbi:hypothetical protein [Streptomyces sp. NPDC023588]|uniref:hypothetical protein n=1 Tax=Streptomyces sp. NPDC023588 TaxID=3154907 RepID=UPI0033EB0F26
MGNRNDELAVLARQAVATAGALRLPVERMHDLGWRLNDYSEKDLLTVASHYSDEDLLTVASALRGTAMMMVMDTSNGELLSDLTGRKVKLRDDEGQRADAVLIPHRGGVAPTVLAALGAEIGEAHPPSLRRAAGRLSGAWMSTRAVGQVRVTP